MVGFDIFSKISEIFMTAHDDEKYERVQETILEAFDSPVGVFGYIDSAGALVCPSMDLDVFGNCEIINGKSVYSREAWSGLWGRAMLEEQPLYSNEPAEVPTGQISISCVLDAPIVYDGKLIGNIMIANSERGYKNSDLLFMERIAKHIAPVLAVRRLHDEKDKEYSHIEKLIQIQHDLALSLVSTNSLDAALSQVLDSILEATDVTAGEIYVVDQENGGIDLITHRGVPREFVELTSHYEPDTLQVKKVMKGVPFYAELSELSPPRDRDILASLDFQAFGVVPVKDKGSVVACINVALKNVQSVSESTRTVVESIASHLGSAITRIRTQQELEHSEERWKALVKSAPNLIAIVDAAGRIEFANRPVLKHLPEELIGKNVSDIIPELYHDIAMETIAQVLKTGENGSFELCFEIPGMDPNWQQVNVSSVRGDNGRESAILISNDITSRKSRESLLYNMRRSLESEIEERSRELKDSNKQLMQEISRRRESEETIQAALEEKTILLREVHHRVKNNLQIIASILDLQALKLGDPSLSAVLKESMNRIYSMSLIHNMLYESNNFTSIDMESFAGRLCEFFARNRDQSICTIDTVIEAEDSVFDINKAIPLGLLLNELLSNCYKHAFDASREDCKVEIHFRKKDDRMLLIVRDNGKGIGDAGIEEMDSLV